MFYILNSHLLIEKEKCFEYFSFKQKSEIFLQKHTCLSAVFEIANFPMFKVKLFGALAAQERVGGVTGKDLPASFFSRRRQSHHRKVAVFCWL